MGYQAPATASVVLIAVVCFVCLFVTMFTSLLVNKSVCYQYYETTNPSIDETDERYGEIPLPPKPARHGCDCHTLPPLTLTLCQKHEIYH